MKRKVLQFTLYGDTYQDTLLHRLRDALLVKLNRRKLTLVDTVWWCLARVAEELVREVEGQRE